jgi:glyoxylase I family protein
MIRGIHHVAIHVRDMDRMINFYREAFGFAPVDEGFTWKDSPEIDEIIGVPGSSARNVMLQAGNCYLEMFQFIAPDPPATKPLDPFNHGYTHFCVDATDIAAEVERLSAIGMTFERAHGRGKPVDFGIVKSLYGRDPEGNLIEIQETAADCPFDASRLPKADLARGDA